MSAARAPLSVSFLRLTVLLERLLPVKMLIFITTILEFD
nr:MAG TPA: hypothetical protein [Caudoviricetes sp.]